MTTRLLSASAFGLTLMAFSGTAATAAPAQGPCSDGPLPGSVAADCSLPYDLGPSGMDAGLPSGFVALAVVMAIVGVGMTIYRVTTARRLAEDAGMDPDRAAAMTLLSDDGLDATYLAASLRGPSGQPSPGSSERSTSERLRELQRLRDEGLVSEEEYDARRRSIVDSI